jgi:hypothetical protein
MGCIPIDPKLYSFVILYIINEKNTHKKNTPLA